MVRTEASWHINTRANEMLTDTDEVQRDVLKVTEFLLYDLEFFYYVRAKLNKKELLVTLKYSI